MDNYTTANFSSLVHLLQRRFMEGELPVKEALVRLQRLVEGNFYGASTLVAGSVRVPKSEELAAFCRRTHELQSRLVQGKLPVGPTMDGLQRLGRGDFTGVWSVDLDARPHVPNGPEDPKGLVVESHRKGEIFDFDPSKIDLYRSQTQAVRHGKVKAGVLEEELNIMPVLNANVLDWFLETGRVDWPVRRHKLDLIPQEWKGHQIFFWGTIYRAKDGKRFVRCLRLSGYGWVSGVRWVDCDWHFVEPAAVAAV